VYNFERGTHSIAVRGEMEEIREQKSGREKGEKEDSLK
jgi:hypothetical protein